MSRSHQHPALPSRSQPSNPTALNTRSSSRKAVKRLSLPSPPQSHQIPKNPKPAPRLSRSRTTSAPGLSAFDCIYSDSPLTPIPSESPDRFSSFSKAHISAFTYIPPNPPPCPLATPFENAPTMGVRAKIEQSNPTKPPTMGEGDVDASLLWDWFNKSEIFFRHKPSISVDARVETIAWGMSGIHAVRWLSANSTNLSSMDWDTYKEHMRNLFLPSDWEHTTRMDVLRVQQGSRAFADFSLDMMARNNLLAGTDSFLNDEFLRDTLEANMDRELARECNRENANSVASFKDWLAEVKRIDERRRARLEEINQAFARLNVRSSSNASRPTTATKTPFAPKNTAVSTSVFVPIPKLLSEERTLLSENGGCFKCRKFWAGHLGARCTAPPIDGSKYKTLTARDVPPRPPNYVSRSAGVSAVVINDENSPPSASISEVEPTVSAVAAVMPETTDCTWVSDGDWSDDEYAPFSCSNLFWRYCLRDVSSPAAPSSVNGLVDNGSAVVLIRSDLADAFGLTRLKAKKPFVCSAAFSGVGKDLSLDEFVHIRPFSQDGLFRSKPLRAFVSPSLVADTILGLPFLRANGFVIDHRSNTCISKMDNCTSYDLFSSSTVPSQSASPWRLTHTRASDVRLARRKAHSDHKEFLSGAEFRVALRQRRMHRLSRPLQGNSVVAAIKDRLEDVSAQKTFQDQLLRMDAEMKKKFGDLFEDLPPVHRLPDQVYHKFRLKDANKVVNKRGYTCPRKICDAWKILLDEALASGKLRPSDSEYASPAFLVPKSDPNALPRWVNDYRELNDNTIPDRFPLPRIDEILADCGKGKIWGKLDMTNAFFQTKVHPDHIKYTAVRTPFGLYEWVVMPQGCRNAPATHQRRMVAALRHLIGKICHVYLDDIIIWSSSLAEHIRNVEAVLLALRDAALYCNVKKTQLFCTSINFLGHHISQAGIQADCNKALKIAEWPTPKTATDVRQFLGLVRYLAIFLPRLADLTSTLTPLTNKAVGRDPVDWQPSHQDAFEKIKSLVVSRECLTVIDHENPGDNKIFVTTDASDVGTGAVLSFGPTWATSRPVAYDSKQLNPAERNYATHDKEMLAIVRALHKWRVDLLGAEFEVYTDHRTLEFFNKQRDLNKKQLRWQTFLADYNFDIRYIKGEDNTVADALSREFSCEPLITAPVLAAGALASVCPAPPTVVAPVLRIDADGELLEKIVSGYEGDTWCQKLLSNGNNIAGVSRRNRLLYVGERLVVPRVPEVRELLFQLAHDALGHYGTGKSYMALRDSFYWPNMHRDLEQAYIPGCVECQRNKSPTVKPVGPLHSLAVPEERFACVALDFVGPLPEDEGYNYLLTITDRLGADVRLIPCKTDLTAERCAALFFEHWYCENGLPTEIVSDRDKLFVSKFWSALHKLTGIKLKLSSSFHPQTDGASERTNKTIIQSLRYYVDRNQSGWVKALPHVRFCFMNTVNASTGFSPFQLRLGCSPRTVPALTTATETSVPSAAEIIKRIEEYTAQAKDSLIASKIAQSLSANTHRRDEIPFKTGDKVFLSTTNRRKEYKHAGDDRVAKFMPRYDGPYEITRCFPERSTYTLLMPNSPDVFPTFHASQLRRFVENDVELFPSRELDRPEAVIVDGTGEEEWLVDKIVDEKRGRGGQEYLVSWKGYGAEENRWLKRCDVEELEALDIWEAQRKVGRTSAVSDTPPATGSLRQRRTGPSKKSEKGRV
ncbi:hypothetical protein CCMSSC00406_0007702 [Pleurotus cornucopiae]|uniref:Uncharacterized protein n=1 Tax=Pleurotus cornucopiae TaxID=5321 RepID=A0ACB7J0M7_PLECO|nr:hypothetical protein CCMSSC00406_0007702 [Pleurotus cornucopiae]